MPHCFLHGRSKSRSPNRGDDINNSAVFRAYEWQCIMGHVAASKNKLSQLMYMKIAPFNQSAICCCFLQLDDVIFQITGIHETTLSLAIG